MVKICWNCNGGGKYLKQCSNCRGIAASEFDLTHRKDQLCRICNGIGLSWIICTVCDEKRTTEY